MYRTRANTKALYKIFQREGLSQNEAARRAGLSTATMVKVMAGKCFAESTGKQLCDAFGVSPDEVLEVVEA